MFQALSQVSKPTDSSEGDDLGDILNSDLDAGQACRSDAFGLLQEVCVRCIPLDQDPPRARVQCRAVSAHPSHMTFCSSLQGADLELDTLEDMLRCCLNKMHARSEWLDLRKRRKHEYRMAYTCQMKIKM